MVWVERKTKKMYKRTRKTYGRSQDKVPIVRTETVLTPQDKKPRRPLPTTGHGKQTLERQHSREYQLNGVRTDSDQEEEDDETVELVN